MKGKENSLLSELRSAIKNLLCRAVQIGFNIENKLLTDKTIKKLLKTTDTHHDFINTKNINTSLG